MATAKHSGTAATTARPAEGLPDTGRFDPFHTDLTPRQTSIVMAQIAAAADQLQKLASEMRDTRLEPPQDAVRDTICSLLGRLRTAELLAGQIGAMAEMHLDPGSGYRADAAAWLLGEHFAEHSAA